MARGGYLDIVQFLIEKGADPKLKDKNGKTAYAYAVENEESDVADYLKKFNWSINFNTKVRCLAFNENKSDFMKIIMSTSDTWFKIRIFLLSM